MAEKPRRSVSCLRPAWGKLFVIAALLVIFSCAPAPKSCLLVRQTRVGKRDYGLLGNLLASYMTSQHSRPDTGLPSEKIQTCAAPAPSPSRSRLSLQKHEKPKASSKAGEKPRKSTTLEFLRKILSLCIPKALPQKLPEYAAHRLSETDSMRMPKQATAAVPGAPWL